MPFFIEREGEYRKEEVQIEFDTVLHLELKCLDER
jgi:hypothetical protein